MAESSGVGTLARGERALKIGSALCSEQLQRRRGRVKDVGILADDGKLAAFVRSGPAAARRIEQSASFVRGEGGAIFRGHRRR
jgi:hypothetical protein